MRTPILALLSIVFACGKPLACHKTYDAHDGGTTNAAATSQDAAWGSADPPSLVIGTPCARINDPPDGPSGCTGVQCGNGGNSPFINKFPINGLLSNACNADQMKLVARSLKGGKCPAGASLAFDSTPSGFELIGQSDNQPPCTGSDLDGATFEIQAWNKPITLTIAKVKNITLTEGLTPFGYYITYNNQPVCNLQASLGILGQLEVHKPVSWLNEPPVGSGSVEPNIGFAVVTPGPIYDEVTGKAVEEPENGSGFFNLACVDDALAKAYAFNLAPATDPAATSVALHMITADYCGKAFTLPGMFFAFIQDHTFPPTHLTREALWDENGNAMCIDTPRLTNSMSDGIKFPSGLPQYLDPDTCQDRNRKHHSPCTLDEWETELRKQCGIPRCATLSRERRSTAKLVSCIQEGTLNYALTPGGFHNATGDCSM